MTFAVFLNWSIVEMVTFEENTPSRYSLTRTIRNCVINLFHSLFNYVIVDFYPLIVFRCRRK